MGEQGGSRRPGWRRGGKGPQSGLVQKEARRGGVQGTPWGGEALTQGRSWQQSNMEVPNLEAPLNVAFPKLCVSHTELQVVWRITLMVQDNFEHLNSYAFMLRVLSVLAKWCGFPLTILFWFLFEIC